MPSPIPGSIPGQEFASAHDVFPHIRIVMGMVIGLGVTRLLSGVARIVQQPKRHRTVATVHMAWVISLLLLLVHFWWWEFHLYAVDTWTFGKYLFVITYAVVLFLMCALLFPDSLGDYGNYDDFFYARRAWFFGFLALSYLFDVADTLLKGEAYYGRFGGEYLVRTPVFVALCLAAIRTPNRRFHILFVGATLVYQLSWILRQFDTIM